MVEIGCSRSVRLVRQYGWVISILQAGNLIFCVHMGDLVMGERCYAKMVSRFVEESWMPIVYSESV